MKTQKLEHFYNEGFGWICKNCERKLRSKSKERSRLMTEGEAESKQAVFSNKGLAKWADALQKTLICPNCDIKESIG